MNPRERKFCQRYHVLGNATQAAKDAGYSAKTAYSQGGRLLKRVEVQRYLAELQGKSEARGLLQVEDLERALQEVIDFDFRRLYRPVLKDGLPTGEYQPIPLAELPDGVARALAGVEVEELWEGAEGERFRLGDLKKWKRFDRTRAIELGMKRRGLLVEKHEQVGPANVTVTIGVRPPKPKAEGKE